MNTRTIGATMRHLREALGYRLKEVAAKAGISEANLSQIETAQRKASIEKIVAIANALNIPPLLLFYCAGDNSWMTDQTRALMELEMRTRVITHSPDQPD